jgi:oligoribonuclease NrnB/cAMP/cGMP phosphodiesterase (DHH superfamily)
MERVIKTEKDVVVIYHANCEDGFSAAWAAHQKFGDTAEYFEFQNGDMLYCEAKDKKIFFLDVVPSLEELQFVSAENDVFTIDHHKSNSPKLTSSDKFIFDLDKSGAMLAWEYFCPNIPAPLLINYVQDQDLWRWELPYSKEIYAHISVADTSLSSWSKLAEELEVDKDKVIEKGRLLLNYRKNIVQETVRKTATLVEFEGYRVLAANSSTLTDETAEALYLQHPPFAIVWFKIKTGIRVSLRGNGTIDLSVFAEKYGGGGHKNSCGFIVESVEKLPWKEIKE